MNSCLAHSHSPLWFRLPRLAAFHWSVLFRGMLTEVHLFVHRQTTGWLLMIYLSCCEQDFVSYLLNL